MTRLDIARFIDRYFGDILCGFFGIFSRSSLSRHPKRILVIRLWTLGESLLTLPMIQKLKEEYPQASLEILATSRSQEVFQGHTFIHYIRLFSVSQFFKLFLLFRKYDLVIDTEPYFRLTALLAFWLGRSRIGFDHGVRSSLYTVHGHYALDDHAVHSFCSLLSPLGVHYRPQQLLSLPFSEQDRQSVLKKLYSLKKNRCVIAMHTSTSESVKERAWPLSHFVKLIHLCTKNDVPFVVILTGYSLHDSARNGSIMNALQQHAHVYNWSRQWNFREFCALLSLIDFFIANDSGPMHLAAAQGATTIGLFGPETPKRYAPFPLERHISLYKNPEFGIGPCIQPWLGKTLDCSRQIEALRSISPEDVFDVLMTLYRNKTQREPLSL